VFAISVGLFCAHMNVCVGHVTKKKRHSYASMQLLEGNTLN